MPWLKVGWCTNYFCAIKNNTPKLKVNISSKIKPEKTNKYSKNEFSMK
jgi:hypothetical protein